MNHKKINIENLLKDGNNVQFPISGWSMYPFLYDQDFVTVLPASKISQLHVNDVILYRRINGPLVLHRIVRKNTNGLFLCGDNQNEIEGPLCENQIIGKMTEYIHNAKKVSVNSPSYVFYSSLWRLLLPMRPFISRIIHKIRIHYGTSTNK